MEEHPIQRIGNNQEAEKWLPLSEASLLTPYSAEYLSLLARKGKLSAKKVNDVWYTTKSILDAYMKRQMAVAQVRNGGNVPAQASVPVPAQGIPAEQVVVINTPKTPLKTIRSYADDHREHLARIESENPHIQIERALEKVIEKKFNTQTSRVFELPKEKIFGGRIWHTPKGVVGALLLGGLLLSLLPVPAVYSFFEKSIAAAREALNDANTVMGFRPGTHENEILLLDKEGKISIMGHVETYGQLRSHAENGIAPIVVDSATQVDNLNAQYVGGFESKDFTLAFVTKNGNVTTEDVKLSGNVEVGKTLLVSGAAKLLSTLEVQGNLKVFGKAEFAKTLEVLGSAFFRGLLTAESAHLYGSITVDRGIDADTAYFNTAGIGGDFSVSGNTDLANATSTNFFAEEFTALLSTITDLIADDISVDALTAVNSTTTNATTTNSYAINSDIDRLTFDIATGTSATTTNFFSDVASTTSLFANSASLSNLNFSLAIGTSATTTNFFSTTASSTNVFSTSANLGSLSLGTLTSNFVLSGNDADITFTGTGNHDITATGGTLRLGSNVVIGNIEALDDTIDIGTPGVRFDSIYANEVNATTLVGTLTGGNLTAETFNINSDNATGDTEDSFLSFERGSESPNALLMWDASEDLFDFNFGVEVNGSFLATGSTTLQNFTFVNATGTNATTTNLASSIIRTGNGSASAPSFSFTSDTDTGWYRAANDDIRLAMNTDDALRISNIGGWRVTQVQGGTAAGPGLSFIGDTDTGLYSVGTNRLGISTAGTARWEFDSSGHLIAATDNTYDIGTSAATRPRSVFVGTKVSTGDGSVDAPSFTFGSNDSQGMWFSPSTVNFSSSGLFSFYTGTPGSRTVKWSIDSSGNWDAGTDNTYDIGASGATRPRTGYFGTSIVVPLVEATNILATGSTTLQNFTFVNATGTNATTTNLFVSGLASTTSLIANTGLFNRNVGIGPGATTSGESLEVVGNVISKGTSWTSRTSASGSWLGIAYGNGLFVAVQETGSGNRVMTSPDGINWTSRTSAADNAWKAVTYGNGLFVAVANSGTGDRIMTSPDGINWTSRTNPENNDWRGVTYGNGTFVAVASTGTNRVMTSPDGITWTARSASTANSWYGVTYGNGLFVATSISGNTTGVMTSPNGITWTTRTTPAAAWRSVAYGNGVYVAVSSNVGQVMSSPDGTTWTSRTTPLSSNSWEEVTYGNGLFVAVASTGTSGNMVMTSPDGITWTARRSAADKSWQGVAYGNGVFVAVAQDISGTDVMTSGKQDGYDVQHNNLYQGSTAFSGNVSVGTTTNTLERLTVDGTAKVVNGPGTATTLTSGITGSDTTLPVASTANYPISGTLVIGSEAMTYTGKTSTSFTGVTRGVLGSSAGVKSSGSSVELVLLSTQTNAGRANFIQLGSGQTGYGFGSVFPFELTRGADFSLQKANGSGNLNMRLYSGGSTGSTFVTMENAGCSITCIHAFGQESGTAGTTLTGSEAYAAIVSAGGTYPIMFGTNGVVRSTITSTGNMGIGTSSPNQKLSIFNNAADAAIEFSTVSGANEKWTIGIDDSDGAKFKIASSSALGTSDRFVIDGNGDVGINQADPLQKLDVGGNIALNSNALYLSTGNDATWTFGREGTPSGAQINTVAAAVLKVYGQTANQGFMIRNDLGTSLFEMQGTDGRTYLAGSVGVGTSTPQGKLHIASGFSGTTPYTGGGTPAFVVEQSGGVTTQQFLTTDNGVSRIWFGDGGGGTTDGLIEYDHNATPSSNDIMTFRAGGTDTLFLKGGNVGISTTTPQAKLSVEDSSGSNVRLSRSATGAIYDIQITTNGSQNLLAFTPVTVSTGYRFDTRNSGGTVVSGLLNIIDQNIGISTTTPWGKLSITNEGAGPSFVVEDSASSDSSPFIIDAAGSVAIGMADTSNAKLTVNSAADNSSVIQLFAGGSQRGIIATDSSSNLLIRSASGLDLRLGSNADHVTINTSGSVGIGTTSPQTIAHVYTTGGTNQLRVERFGGTAGTRGKLDIWHSNIGYTGGTGADSLLTSDWGIQLRVNNQSTGDNSGTAAVTVTNGGNVGIGVVNPGAKLQISGGSLDTGTLTDLGISTALTTGRTGSYDSSSLASLSTRGDGSSVEVVAGSSSGFYSGFTATANNAGTLTGTARIFTAGSERLRIASSGNVGIGTTTPQSLLHVYGTSPATRVENSDNTIILDQLIGSYEVYSADASGPGAGVRGSLNVYGGSGGGPSYLTINTSDSSTNNVERFRIDATGMIGIGTTTPSSNLHVEGNNAKLTVHGGSIGGAPSIDLVRDGQQTWTLAHLSNSFGIQDVDEATTPFRIEDDALTDTLRLTTAGDVGIGDSSPDAKLEIINDGSGASFLVADNGDGDTSPFVIQSNGATGVGTSTPRYKFDIRGGDLAFDGGDLIFADAGGTTNNIEYITTNDGGITGLNTTAVFSFHADTSLGQTVTSPSAGISVAGIYSSTAVGIGTTTPAFPLSVQANSGTNALQLIGRNNGTADEVSLTFSNNDGVTQAGFQANNSNLLFATGANGLERMRIDSSGNIGIGTTSPNALLSLYSTGYPTVNNVNTALVIDGTSSSGGIMFTNSSASSFLRGVGGQFVIYTSSDKDINSGEERLSITSAGHVGIGTTTSEGILSIKGSSGSTNYIRLMNDATNNDVIRLTDCGTGIDSGIIALKDGGTTKVNLVGDDDSTSCGYTYFNAGNVGIGTTTPVEILEVVGNIKLSGNIGLNIDSTVNLNGNGGNTYIKSLGGSGQAIQHTAAATDTMYEGAWTAGSIQFPNVGTTASAANVFMDSANSNLVLRVTSSLRYKTDVRTLDVEESLRVVSDLRPVLYKSLASADDPDADFLGLIAEEVALIDPKLVYYDNLGRPDGVQYERVVVHLLGFSQNLETRLARVELDLEAASTSLAISTSTPGFVAAVLDTMKATIVDGVTHFVKLAVESLTTHALTVGESDKPSGITVYDEVTGEPMCLTVRNGDIRTEEGECGTVTGDEEPVNNPSEEVVIGDQNDPEPEETASSTPDTATSTPGITEGDPAPEPEEEPLEEVTEEPEVIEEAPEEAAPEESEPDPEPVVESTETNGPTE